MNQFLGPRNNQTGTNKQKYQFYSPTEAHLTKNFHTVPNLDKTLNIFLLNCSKWKKWASQLCEVIWIFLDFSDTLVSGAPPIALNGLPFVAIIKSPKLQFQGYFGQNMVF